MAKTKDSETEAEATYDGPVKGLVITEYTQRFQVGGPSGPVAAPGDITVVLDDDILLIHSADAESVRRIIAWYQQYAGAIGGGTQEVTQADVDAALEEVESHKDTIGEQAELIKGQVELIHDQVGQIEGLGKQIDELLTVSTDSK